IERKHAENSTKRSAEHGKLERHGNKGGPAIERAPADIHWVCADIRPILKTETTKATGKAAKKRKEGHIVALEAHSVREPFHGERRVRVYAVVAGFADLFDRMNELFRSIKLRQHAVNA